MDAIVKPANAQGLNFEIVLIIANFPKFSQLCLIFGTCLDLFGPVRMHSDAFKCVQIQFEASNKIKVIMATNRLDILDPALLRPGRIDRKIEFPNPTEESRVDILKIHSRKMNLVRGIDLKSIASKMGGASGAESKAVCTEAGMYALRERRVHVTQEDFEMAVSKVMTKDTDKNISIKKLTL